MVETKTKRGSDVSEEASDYDLILRDKERLLSFDEPTRFIFSHSALREGWDNPNIFQICTLRHSNSTTAKRQEVGRGLRIAVDRNGVRQDKELLGEEVHNINILTVIANDSYSDIFTAASKADFDKAYQATKHVTDYVVSDSIGERNFAHDLDEASEVVVYAKLPRTFRIPTPVGSYAPDWAIAMQKGNVKHIFFIAETKGSLQSMQLNAIENTKIDCCTQLFNEMSTDSVRYHKVTCYQDLIDAMTSVK